jgi:hypothetical protein
MTLRPPCRPPDGLEARRCWRRRKQWLGKHGGGGRLSNGQLRPRAVGAIQGRLPDGPDLVEHPQGVGQHPHLAALAVHSLDVDLRDLQPEPVGEPQRLDVEGEAVHSGLAEDRSGRRSPIATGASSSAPMIRSSSPGPYDPSASVKTISSPSAASIPARTAKPFAMVGMAGQHSNSCVTCGDGVGAFTVMSVEPSSTTRTSTWPGSWDRCASSVCKVPGSPRLRCSKAGPQ